MAERIEIFAPEHLDGCARLLVSAFNAEPWNESWTFANARKSLVSILDAGFIGFVYLDRGEVLGFAAGYREQDDRREVFYLDTLCVGPDAQGSGVGSRLLDRLKDELEKTSINSIYLITHRGTPAENFYRKNGYRISEEDVVMIREW